MKKKLPLSFYNPVTLTGASLAALSFGLILFLMLLQALSPEPKPYMGIIAFVLLPAFLLVGLGIAAVGIYKEHRKSITGKRIERKFPLLDLNEPKHRRAFILFAAITILLLLFSAFGSYQAYEYTDSDEFCGTICHSVMNPEYTAYKNSPHARVGCVNCHIGSGAEWYVRSKFSGAYQVYSVLFNKYSRPIPTPISNLRPAQETCEQCHWPKNFFSEKKVVFNSYLSDSVNTKSTLTMLLKIGGGNSELGTSAGIHWHMNIANKVLYYPLDESRQTIPWVKIISNETGKEEIYKIKGFDASKLNPDSIRTMDCIDCHNRPTHIYRDPYSLVDNLMAVGRIDNKLPYIRSIAVESMESQYTRKDIALDSIKIKIADFYSSNYPYLAEKEKDKIDTAIRQIQNVYSLNYFPEMRVNWKYFPNNIGHLYSPGCFRCHDGQHYSDSGKVISKDCNICHTILAQQIDDEPLKLSLNGVNYTHPVDIGNSWKEENCDNCHSGK